MEKLIVEIHEGSAYTGCLATYPVIYTSKDDFLLDLELKVIEFTKNRTSGYFDFAGIKGVYIGDIWCNQDTPDEHMKIGFNPPEVYTIDEYFLEAMYGTAV